MTCALFLLFGLPGCVVGVLATFFILSARVRNLILTVLCVWGGGVGGWVER